MNLHPQMNRAHTSIQGFTLVEMMVSLAVLGIMVVILNQLIGSGVSTILRVKSSLNADAQARTLFDTIQRDVDGFCKRSDVDVIFYKPTGTGTLNDLFFAYSWSNAYFDGTSFTSTQKNGNSLIGYRINEQATNNNGLTYYGFSSYGQMERLGKALAWENSDYPNVMPFLGYAAYTGTSTSWAAISSTTIAGMGFKSKDGNNTVGTLAQGFTNGTDSDYQVVGNRVFRMELSYLLADGTQSNIPIENPNYGGTTLQDNLTATRAPMASDDSTEEYGVGSRWYDTNAQIGYICISASVGQAVWTQLGIQDLQALVVTIALIPGAPIANPANSQTTIIAQAPSVDLNALASLFPKAGTNPHGTYTDVAGTLVSNWLSVVNNAGSGTSPMSGLPNSIAGGIHVYQRYIFLQN